MRARHPASDHSTVDSCNISKYRSPMTHDAELDATGLLCPLPVLKARKRLQALQSGQVLHVLADDPAAIVDMPHFCIEQGHELLGQNTDSAPQSYLIKKR